MIGEGTNHHRIERWLTAVVFGPGTPPGGLRLTLHHASVDEAQRLLRTWQLEGIPGKEEFHNLVGEIDGEASEDTEHLGWGVQRYLLRAANTQGRELGSLSIRYSTNSLANDAGAFADSEPASARGQVALSMRHTDAAYRLLSAGFGGIMESFTRRMSQQDALLEKLLNAQMRVFEEMQELAEKRLERDVLVEAKKKETELDFMKEVQQMDRSHTLMKLGVDRVAPLIPVIVNRLFGEGTLPVATRPSDELLAALLGSLTEEQATALKGILSPTQLTNLQELSRAAHAARTAAADSSTSTAGTSESDDKKLSEESAYIALEHIQKELIPWALGRMKAGQPVDPTTALPKSARIFQLLLRALTRAQYDELVSQNEPFNAEERKAFVKMAETLGVVPEADKPSPASKGGRDSRP